MQLLIQLVYKVQLCPAFSIAFGWKCIETSRRTTPSLYITGFYWKVSELLLEVGFWVGQNEAASMAGPSPAPAWTPCFSLKVVSCQTRSFLLWSWVDIGARRRSKGSLFGLNLQSALQPDSFVRCACTSRHSDSYPDYIWALKHLKLMQPCFLIQISNMCHPKKELKDICQ